MAKALKHLQYYERELIAEFRAAGRSLGYIAEILERAKSTISSELRRNSRNGRYNPAIAEALARKRASKTRVASKIGYFLQPPGIAGIGSVGSHHPI